MRVIENNSDFIHDTSVHLLDKGKVKAPYMFTCVCVYVCINLCASDIYLDCKCKMINALHRLNLTVLRIHKDVTTQNA